MFGKKNQGWGIGLFVQIGVQQIRACASRGIPAHQQVIVSDLFAPAGVLSHGWIEGSSLISMQSKQLGAGGAQECWK